MSNTESQDKRVLRWLKSGKTLTPMEALDRFSSMRLSARIHRLREQGYKIKSRLVSVGKCRVAEYSL